MALQKQKRKKITPRLLLITGLILLAIIICSFLIINSITPSTTPPVEEESPVSTPTEEKSDKDPEENKEPEKTDPSSPNEEKKTAPTYEGEDPNKKEDLTGTITTSRVSGDNLIIRISIDQYLSSGVCKLSLKKSDKTYEKSADISSDASTSTCEGFDIPISELENGSWTILVELDSGNKNGKIEGGVTI